jgi:hypothetical protein
MIRETDYEEPTLLLSSVLTPRTTVDVRLILESYCAISGKSAANQSSVHQWHVLISQSNRVILVGGKTLKTPSTKSVSYALCMIQHWQFMDSRSA